MTTEEKAISLFRALPLEQQQKALNYLESLQAESQDESLQPEISVLEAGAEIWGSVEGAGDVSTNPRYMEGFGK